MLDDIVRNHDLSGAEFRVLFYLAYTRTDATSGLCYASDQNIADALNLHLRSVKKLKKSLHEKKLLDWNTERTGAKNNVSLFTIKGTTSGNHAQTAPQEDNRIIQETRSQMGTSFSSHLGTANNRTTLSDAQTGTTSHAQMGTTQFLAKDGSPEWHAWDRYTRITTGKGLPRSDRYGGWHVPSQWPPKLQMSLADCFAT